jgi:hypothetical protein
MQEPRAEPTHQLVSSDHNKLMKPMINYITTGSPAPAQASKPPPMSTMSLKWSCSIEAAAAERRPLLQP